MTEEILDAPVVVKLMREARRISRQIDRLLAPLPDGWSLALFEPNELFDAFPRLQLRAGFQLAGYQYCEGRTACGFVFAIPARRWLPDPSEGGLELDWSEDGTPLLRSNQPLPEWVRPDIETFLEGDHSPLSYFQASIFMRELMEMGSIRRGGSWPNHRIVTAADQIAGQNWIWEGESPQEWRPVVQRKDTGLLQVIFYTHTGLRRERIVAHQDTFTSGYSFESADAILARGQGGYLL
jgi:hypothetical protein